MDDDLTKASAIRLELGLKFPYDAPDIWWEGEGTTPPRSDDWAHAAARGIVADLKDRGGIKHILENLDEEVRINIVTSIAAIIREARRREDVTLAEADFRRAME